MELPIINRADIGGSCSWLSPCANGWCNNLFLTFCHATRYTPRRLGPSQLKLAWRPVVVGGFGRRGPIWRTRGWPKQSAAQFAGPWPLRQQGWRARSTSSGAKIASFFCILPKTIHLFFLYQTNTGFEWHTHTDRHRSYCMERVRSDLIVRSVELSRPGRKTKACQGASVFVSQAAGTVA